MKETEITKPRGRTRQRWETRREEREWKREREKEREDNPLFFLGLWTPNAGDISTNQITPRAPPFIIILLVFPLLHPHWMTFPGPYHGIKKKVRAPRRGLHASSQHLVSSGTLLVPLPWSSNRLQEEFLSGCTCGGLARCLSFARAKLNCETCTRYYETLTASWFDFVPSKPEPKANS